MIVFRTCELTKGFGRFIEMNKKLASMMAKNDVNFLSVMCNLEETKAYIVLENNNIDKSMEFLAREDITKIR